MRHKLQIQSPLQRAAEETVVLFLQLSSCCFTLFSLESCLCRQSSRVRKEFKLIYVQTLGFSLCGSLFSKIPLCQFPTAFFSPDFILWQTKPLQHHAPVLAAPCRVDGVMLSGDKVHKHELKSVWSSSLKRQIPSNFYLTSVIFFRAFKWLNFILSRVYNCYMKER